MLKDYFVQNPFSPIYLVYFVNLQKELNNVNWVRCNVVLKIQELIK